MAVITTATLMDILTGGEMTTGIILTDRTWTGAGTTAVNIMNGIMAKENIIGKITTGKPLLQPPLLASCLLLRFARNRSRNDGEEA